MAAHRMSGERIVCADTAELARRAADWMAAVLAAAIELHGRAIAALAGGGTPRDAYGALAHAPLDWSRLELLLADERCVPPDDPEANARLVRETLIEPLGSRAPRLHLPPGIERDPEAAARDYAALLPAALDLVVLGIGEDGHVASLFPGAPALEESERLVVVVRDSPKPPPQRLTLTPPALATARSTLVLVAGESKAQAVAAALEGHGSPREVPARLARAGTWILDRAAASRLQSEGGS